MLNVVILSVVAPIQKMLMAITSALKNIYTYQFIKACRHTNFKMYSNTMLLENLVFDEITITRGSDKYLLFHRLCKHHFISLLAKPGNADCKGKKAQYIRSPHLGSLL